MVRLVRAVPVVPAHPAVLVADRARHRIARPAGTEFIDVREEKIRYPYGGAAFPHQKKEGKNERVIDFISDHGRVDFRAGLAIAAHGHLYMSEASLSGQGQEENT
jgi:hypothetical protein